MSKPEDILEVFKQSLGSSHCKAVSINLEDDAFVFQLPSPPQQKACSLAHLNPPPTTFTLSAAAAAAAARSYKAQLPRTTSTLYMARNTLHSRQDDFKDTFRGLLHPKATLFVESFLFTLIRFQLEYAQDFAKRLQVFIGQRRVAKWEEDTMERLHAMVATFNASRIVYDACPALAHSVLSSVRGDRESASLLTYYLLGSLVNCEHGKTAAYFHTFANASQPNSGVDHLGMLFTSPYLITALQYGEQVTVIKDWRGFDPGYYYSYTQLGSCPDQTTTVRFVNDHGEVILPLFVSYDHVVAHEFRVKKNYVSPWTKLRTVLYKRKIPLTNGNVLLVIRPTLFSFLPKEIFCIKENGATFHVCGTAECVGGETDNIEKALGTTETFELETTKAKTRCFLPQTPTPSQCLNHRHSRGGIVPVSAAIFTYNNNSTNFQVNCEHAKTELLAARGQEEPSWFSLDIDEIIPPLVSNALNPETDLLLVPSDDCEFTTLQTRVRNLASTRRYPLIEEQFIPECHAKFDELRECHNIQGEICEIEKNLCHVVCSSTGRFLAIKDFSVCRYAAQVPITRSSIDVSKVGDHPGVAEELTKVPFRTRRVYLVVMSIEQRADVQHELKILKARYQDSLIQVVFNNDSVYIQQRQRQRVKVFQDWRIKLDDGMTGLYFVNNNCSFDDSGDKSHRNFLVSLNECANGQDNYDVILSNRIIQAYGQEKIVYDKTAMYLLKLEKGRESNGRVNIRKRILVSDDLFFVNQDTKLIQTTGELFSQQILLVIGLVVLLCLYNKKKNLITKIKIKILG